MAKRHGLSGTPTYFVWKTMRQRCENENCRKYEDYGGRGIRVCDRWQSYPAFLADMGECPPGLSLERKDNDGHYEPGNCVWADRKTQANNKRNCLFLSFQGERLTAAQWGDRLGIKENTIVQRLRRGWSVEKALATPLLNRARQSYGRDSTGITQAAGRQHGQAD